MAAAPRVWTCAACEDRSRGGAAAIAPSARAGLAKAAAPADSDDEFGKIIGPLSYGGDAHVIEFLKSMLTWWNGATVGTRIFTRKHGTEVGRDETGNIYYRNADASRRWVIYAGEVEATKISADWHGWMHFTWDDPPTGKPPVRKSWEKPHLPNQTGTDEAYRPPGSIATPAPRPRVTGDYAAWQPE